MKYRKKPFIIEAVQYDGNFRCLDIFSIDDVGKFIVGTDDMGNPCLKIPTLEGVMIASKGDYIIKGVKGEYYPCKPDIFEMTYERCEPTVIQAPINNYDVWDEVIDQVGSTNEMIDQVPDVRKMVDLPKMEQELDESLANETSESLEEWMLNKREIHNYKLGLDDGYNLAKKNLYTEEQVRDIVLKFAEESTFLRQGIAILWVKKYFKSLKQYKQ